MNAKRKLPLILGIIVLVIVLILALFIFFEHNHNRNIPESDIANTWAENTIIPYSIQEIESSSGITPGIKLDNGNMIIFTKPDGSGWSLKEDDVLSWVFTKQPIGFDQSLSVGYIKDKTVYSPFSYEELEGEFTIKADTEGVYYIYCLGTSSDPITLKEGEIKVKE